MNLKLDGKKVLVTGSSHGIGLEIAKAFLAENCIVVLNARNEKDEFIITSMHILIGDVSSGIDAKNVVKEAQKMDGGHSHM